jgi:hypothetical protein
LWNPQTCPLPPALAGLDALHRQVGPPTGPRSASARHRRGHRRPAPQGLGRLGARGAARHR